MENPVVLSTVVAGLAIELRAFGLASIAVAMFIYPMYIKSMVDGHQSPPRVSVE